MFQHRGPQSRISGTGHYVPETIVSNAQLAERLETTEAWIYDHTGIKRRRVAGPGEATSDMAAAAARKAIEAAGLTVADLDLIILATSTSDSPLPASAAHLQQKLGADLIPSFDLNASSTGFLYAVSVADQFIGSGTYKTVLVVGADAMSRVVDPNDRTTGILFGDGAGAVVMTPALGDGRGVLSTRLHADGTQHELMKIQAGGSAEPLSVEAIESGRQYLRIDGAPLRDLTVKYLTTYSMHALKAAHLTSADLDWVVPQQANMAIVRTISERLGFPLERFVLDVAEFGNTGSASIPIALDEAVRDGRIAEHQNVLMCALGAGITWGSMIVRL